MYVWAGESSSSSLCHCNSKVYMKDFIASDDTHGHKKI